MNLWGVGIWTERTGHSKMEKAIYCTMQFYTVHPVHCLRREKQWQYNFPFSHKQNEPQPKVASARPAYYHHTTKLPAPPILGECTCVLLSGVTVY